MIADLPYPHKVLWPNGRTNSPAYRRSIQKAHKDWAFKAAGCGLTRLPNGEAVKVRLIVSPMPRGPLPDKDNVIAACKYYLDGIALAIGVNDRFFSAPEVVFEERRQYGNLKVELTPCG